MEIENQINKIAKVEIVPKIIEEWFVINKTIIIKIKIIKI